MVRNPIFVELADITETLSEMSDIFDPCEIEQFNFDCGFYSAMRSVDYEPDAYDITRLSELRKVLKETE